MTVLQQISVGLPFSRFARRIARAIASGSWPSTRADHLPAVGLEALRRVVREPARDLAVDRDAVVVVEADELAEAPGPGERAGLVRDALHQAAVAEEHPGVVVDDLVPGTVEGQRELLLRERHADRVREPLAERAGRGLDADRRSRARGGPRCARRAGGSSGARRCRAGSRSGAAPNRAASSRGRSRARSGRGRPSAGLPGLCFRKSRQSTSAMSAMPIGMPGWPELARCTASMLRARMALASSRRLGIGTLRRQTRIVAHGV